MRPEGLRTVERALRFGSANELTSGRLAQARNARLIETLAINLLPPMRIADGLVVDVGANVGDFTGAILAIEPRARVLAIEPVPATRTMLAARFAGDGRVRVDGHAIADSSGTTEMNLTANSVFASLLPPRESIHSEYVAGGTQVTGGTQVPTARLDDLIDEPVSVLKIDVQGAEAALLRGAERTLRRTRAVLLEVVFVSHYEGDVTFPDLHRAMETQGWTLWAMTAPHREAGAALWADACYVPRSTR